jgi:hypothetical protein
MSVTYKAQGECLLFSNGNSYAKVATATGWKYSFRRDSDTAQESRDIEEDTLHAVAVASNPSSNWLTF